MNETFTWNDLLMKFYRFNITSAASTMIKPITCLTVGRSLKNVRLTILTSISAPVEKHVYTMNEGSADNDLRSKRDEK